MAIGESAKYETFKIIKNLGSNLLVVLPGHQKKGPLDSSGQWYSNLTMADCYALKKKCFSLAGVTPMISFPASVKWGEKKVETFVYGVFPDFLQIRNYQLSQGRFFSFLEIKENRRVCVLGKKVYHSLLKGASPLGKIVRISSDFGSLNCRIVGVLKEKGQFLILDFDDLILLPATTLLNLANKSTVSRIYAQARTFQDLTVAKSQIEKVLFFRHKKVDFNVRTQKELINIFSLIGTIFTFLLGGIASISLIVGGIGVMNIMLVSVSERTREIGLRKAIGARKKDIYLQFLLEAIIISLLGGSMGILLGIGGSYLISLLTRWTCVISFFSVLIAFFFALTVGVVFGFYPAKKASQLSPIEALRYE
jgi:putative ABC transport system permease protein